jgi:hypothetical protein
MHRRKADQLQQATGEIAGVSLAPQAKIRRLWTMVVVVVQPLTRHPEVQQRRHQTTPIHP